MNPEKKKAHDFYQQIKLTMKREDIMTFVNGLHDLQNDMLEELVARKEKQGFPEATAVINDIINNPGKFGRIDGSKIGPIIK